MAVLGKHLSLKFIVVAALIGAYLFLLAILRNQLDPKGFRDVMIPILFFWLGRNTGDPKYADRLLKVAIAVVLFFGFFELFFLNWYSNLFNIFSYYVSQGGIIAGSNWSKDSVLGLNGIRPQGIGRTILPMIFGSHRISSVFLEPVSLGNFSVIVASWGLSKNRDEAREMAFFLLAAVMMIVLSDSRYGMVAVALLAAMRWLLRGRANTFAVVFPLLCVSLLLTIAIFFKGPYGDNIPGRLYISGSTLLNFDLDAIFGLAAFNINFGDMGYPSLLTRLGMCMCIFLWLAFWMCRMRDQRGERFRAYVSLYVSLILCVSGTSLFALKSAGILWFLVGCCARRDDDPASAAGDGAIVAPIGPESRGRYAA